jgi:hypothetical protein
VPSAVNQVIQKAGTAKDTDAFVAAFTPKVIIL